MRRRGARYVEGGLVAAAKDDHPKAPPLIERFVRQLVVVNKAVSIYPPSSEIPGNAAAACIEVFKEVLNEVPEVRFSVTRTNLIYEGAPIFPGNKAFADFSHELYLRKLAEMRFHAGLEAKDLIAFLTVLKYSPEEVEAAGGFEARLWDQGVSAITVRVTRVTLVEIQVDSSEAEGPASAPSEMAVIDDALSAAMSGRDYDEVVLTRLIGEPKAVSDYLQQVYEANLNRAALVAVGERFSALGSVASAVGRGDEHELYRALAEALSRLEPRLQRSLLVEEVLPESRTSPAIAAVVRQMGTRTISQLFVDGLVDGEAGRQQLVRAIRGLALISAGDREEIAEMASSVMRDSGMSEAEVADVMEQAMPTRLTVRPGAPVAGSPAADAVFQVLDIPHGLSRASEIGPALAAIREEAACGVTEGDVVTTMVLLAGLDTRPAQFASTMSVLEDALDYLIESGAVEVAADAAISLGEAAKNPELTPEQRLRIEQAVDRFARPSDVRELARTLRVYPKGSPEYDSARRLLDLLGARALTPLLENLADEPDMAARKSLVDVLSTMARENIPRLGACVSDSRWYFVRNVVAILSSTKSSAVLTYLERTLRHPDARVRRETIRGLSGINDRLASEMLIASLNDEDTQNVQLAARYLGQSGVRSAAPALEAVARGEGRGNRDTGPRAEAIEALGRLGATEALPTLNALAGKRSLLHGGRDKELRAVASAAIAAIKSKGAGR